MKKHHAVFALLLFVAALALGVSLVAVTPAAATQKWATQTGKACGYCHVDPQGEGSRTAAGNAFLANGHVLPTVTTVAPATTTTVRVTTTTRWSDHYHPQAYDNHPQAYVNNVAAPSHDHDYCATSAQAQNHDNGE